MIVLLIALNSISIPCVMSVYRSNHSITNDSITNITNDSITNDSISITNDSITNSTEHRIMIVLLIALNSISIPCVMSVYPALIIVLLMIVLLIVLNIIS